MNRIDIARLSRKSISDQQKVELQMRQSNDRLGKLRMHQQRFYEKEQRVMEVE
jgi:hypothetical protein